MFEEIENVIIDIKKKFRKKKNNMFDKNLNKRILAYVIDSTIVLLLTLLITNIKYLNPTFDDALEKSNTLEKLNTSNILIQNYLPICYKDEKIEEEEYNELIKDNEYFGYLVVDAYSDKVITKEEYDQILLEAKNIYNEKAPSIYKEALKANWYTYVIYFVVYLAYFVIFNLITNGITLGKKITGLQIVNVSNSKITWSQYLVRSFLAYGYFIYLIEIVIPYIIPDNYIVKVAGILSLIMNTLQIIVAVSVIFNTEHLGLHDRLAKTKVIDPKDKVLEARIIDLQLLSDSKARELEKITKEEVKDGRVINVSDKQENGKKDAPITDKQKSRISKDKNLNNKKENLEIKNTNYKKNREETPAESSNKEKSRNQER